MAIGKTRVLQWKWWVMSSFWLSCQSYGFSTWWNQMAENRIRILQPKNLICFASASVWPSKKLQKSPEKRKVCRPKMRARGLTAISANFSTFVHWTPFNHLPLFHFFIHSCTIFPVKVVSQPFSPFSLSKLVFKDSFAIRFHPFKLFVFTSYICLLNFVSCYRGSESLERTGNWIYSLPCSLGFGGFLCSFGFCSCLCCKNFNSELVIACKCFWRFWPIPIWLSISISIFELGSATYCSSVWFTVEISCCKPLNFVIRREISGQAVRFWAGSMGVCFSARIKAVSTCSTGRALQKP